MKAVAVELRGGLGNQMFQYAAGLALARRAGCGLVLDATAFRRDRKRLYALDQWGIDGPLIRERTRRRWFETLDCRRAPGSWLRGLGLVGAVYAEPHFHYDEQLWQQRPPVLLKGYWQSYRYLEGVEAELRAAFRPRASWPQQAQAIRARLEAPATVAIHIRRGDYVSDPAANAMHGVCEPDYFLRALDRLRANGCIGEVFVFTDDPDWAAQHFLPRVGGTLVSGDKLLDDAQELWLMSRAAHHIIANSSFSWWAAWLGCKDGQLVVAPKRWFADASRGTSDLLPTEWIRL